MLFGKAITAKGNKFMLDPKAKKAEKKTVYQKKKDPTAEEKKEEGMENWTEEQLREAVEKKHGKEKKKALKAAEKKNQISLEDLIERERAALGLNQTRITLETFTIWKTKKRAEKKKKREEEEKAKSKKAKAGQVKGLTGRELFAFEANVGGDDEEAEDIVIEKEEDDDTVKVHEIDDNFFAAAPSALHLSKGAVPSTVNENRFDHLEKIDTPKDEKAPDADVKVDEDLFGDDDLDDIDAELGDMALEDAGMKS